MMKKFFLSGMIASIAVVLGFSTVSFGQKGDSRAAAPQALYVEDFNYSAGQLLTGAGWFAHSGAGTNAVAVTSPGLTYTGWPSSGNAASLTTSGEDVSHIFPVQTAGSVYAGVLVNASDAANEVTGIGGYFFHLGPDPIGTTFRGRVFLKKDASNNLAFGISKAGSTVATDIAFSPFSYSLNTTYLIIVKYTIVAGATNDTVEMFINPVLGGAEPAVTLTAPDVGASDINPATVALRQGAAATHPTVRVDGIRVSNTWAGLQTAAPEANADYNGDGRTDFALVRANGANIEWYISDGTNATYNTFGSATTDFLVSEDFDGDNRDDISVWRPAAAGSAGFWILQSATNTVRFDNFGQTGDDPAVVADYDGDGKADPATYRCPASGGPAGQCYFFYRQSGPGTFQNQIVYGPWGFGTSGSFFPNVGDFDGDGKADFCIQRTHPSIAGQGQFVLRRSSDGGAEYITWGSNSDFILPGDYDGDGKSDFCVRRTVSGNRQHYILTRTGNISYVQWGITGDISAPGDYDGDGKQDIAVFRPNADPAQNYFYVLLSSTGALRAFEWGQQGDAAVASWYVH